MSLETTLTDVMNSVLRTACDNCHRRKTRCTVVIDNVCQHCRHQGHACVFSPRSSMGRPRRQQQQQQHQQWQGDLSQCIVQSTQVEDTSWQLLFPTDGSVALPSPPASSALYVIKLLIITRKQNLNAK